VKLSHCLWLSMCISYCSYGQSPIDSLKKLVVEEKAKGYTIDAAYHLYQIGYHLENLRQLDSAVWYYQQVLKSGARSVDSAAASNAIGIVYTNMGLPDRSIPFYLQAISLYDRLNDTTNTVITSNNLAIIYKDKGLYDEALEISFNSLPKLEQQMPTKTLASAYNTIGTVYARIQDYEKAYDYYRKGLGVRLSINHEQGVGSSYNNIGELFIEMNKYDSALKNLSKAVDIRRKIKDMRGVGRSLTLVGHTLIRAGKAQEAKKQLDDALVLNRISADHIGEVSTLNTLATAYLQTKELRKADMELKLARELIQKGNVKEHLRTNLELQAKVYRALNDQSKLVEALDELIIVKDSLLSAEKVEGMLALDIKYETEKKEQEIILLRQQQLLSQVELGKNRMQIYSLVAGLALLVVIAVLLYRLYRENKNGKLASELHTREIHHRVKNNLQILSSIFTIQASMVEDKKVQQIIASTQGRVNAMALIHKKLYMRDDTPNVEIREYIHDLTSSLLFSYGLDDDKAQVDVDDIVISVDKTVSLLLIMNELITNSLKYGCVDNSEAHLQVGVHRNGNSLKLEVSDNGKKATSPGELDNGASFGLKMVKSMVKRLDGEMTMKVESGVTFLITFPLT
jgi:two-component sensor histidine kinase